VEPGRGEIRTWAPGSLFEYTRAVPAPDVILDWEQDNEKMKRGPISVAVDSITVERR
jgi:hypothetical protein